MKRMELWEKFNADNKAVNTFMNLYGRWLDEHEYEDINDYLAVLQKVVPSAYKISKRPFGITCECDDGDIKIFGKIKGKYMTVNAQFID